MPSTPLQLNEQTFDAQTGGGIVLVDFWAPWCGPCRMQEPILQQFAEAADDDVTVAQVNVDENPHLAARFQVQSIPLLVVLHNGQEVQRVVGMQNIAALKQLVQRARSESAA